MIKQEESETSTDNEKFFSSLPPDKLTRHEIALRAAILDFVQERSPRTFPIAEWIDRRIGGEVEVRRNEAGEDELCLRKQPPTGRTPEPQQVKEIFFGSLDPKTFSPEEDALRSAVFEFLARWRSKELATSGAMLSDAGISQRAANFLPKGVQVREWIERRIGGEIEFKPGAGGVDVVHLTPKGRPFVTAKYEEMSAAGTLSAVASKVPTREVFFKSLPSTGFTPQELALRKFLLQFIDNWPNICERLGKPRGTCPVLPDVMREPGMSKHTAFLPKTVSVKDWIDGRIGGEIELRKDERGQFEVRLRESPEQSRKSQKPASVAMGSSPPECPDPVEVFLAKLPGDRHTVAESDLRQTILAYLEGTASAVQLTEMASDPTIAQSQAALLPPNVPLRMWIDRRIGGEVETFVDEAGGVLVRIREEGPAAAHAQAHIPRKRAGSSELGGVWKKPVLP